MGRERINLLLNMMDDRMEHEMWFPPMQRALKDVTAEQAAWKTDEEANTIWGLVNHLTFWMDDVVKRLQGAPRLGPDVDNDATFNIGEKGVSDDAWNAAVQRFNDVYARARAFVEAFTDDSDLDRLYNGQSSVGSLLSNVIMHDAYHTGQIITIRKLQGSWPAHTSY